ncbi:hypothetical protein LSTR_LSTR009690 [Laodelphax striatellus]|uniref:EB domain-containing protein n=1 Tax=Laodelphax striatellus TaxID=195883 RepID=A0A482WNM9_LAOST|nr:hypothetical protein LSTR_LSTR009690 [Laodelphax striatellus]
MVQSLYSSHVVTMLLISILHILRCLPIVVSHNIYAHHINKRQTVERYESVLCTTSETCEEYLECEHTICRNPCRNINCEHIRPETRCLVELHRPVCKLRSELIDSDQWVRENDCHINDDCAYEQWCFDGKCKEACANIDCFSWNDDGYCDVEDHMPVCKFKTTGFDEEQVMELEKEQRALGDACSNSHECAFNLVCKSGTCALACDEVICYTADGYRNSPYPILKANVPEDKPSNDQWKCVSQYHVIKCIANSQENLELYGCDSNDQCGEKQVCVNRKCIDSCKWVDCESWASDAYCDVIDHYGVCRFETFGVPEEQVENLKHQRKLGARCINSFQCEHHLACISKKCTDPCDLLWCLAASSRHPIRLVQKRLFSMEWGFDPNLMCLSEHHTVRCLIPE